MPFPTWFKRCAIRSLRFVGTQRAVPRLSAAWRRWPPANQMRRPRFVVADTMDLWLNIALPGLLKLLKRVDAFVLKDSEARQLTQEDSIVKALARIHKLGPRYVIIKKGEHGAILSAPRGIFLAPAFPLAKVVDPTGAGDAFVGGLIGYLASRGGSIDQHLRRGIV